MKHNILKILSLVAMIICIANVSANDSIDYGNIQNRFMKVAPHKVKVDDKLCYSVRRGYARKDKTQWEPFCGTIYGFQYEPGYEYTLYVVDYDIQADTIYVINKLGRESSWRRTSKYIVVDANRITVNDSVCYKVGEFLGRRRQPELVPFCGEFELKGDTIKEGYSYLLKVDEYDPKAQMMHILDMVKRY